MGTPDTTNTPTPDPVAAWMESLGFSRLIDDTTPLNAVYYKQAGFGLIDTFTARFFYQQMLAARKRAANDIFNLAHQYAQDDKTMVGSEELRAYHYFNAIHTVGEFDGR